MQTIGFINFFEQTTQAKVKDCFYENETLVFIVNEGQIHRALGKGGEKIRKVSARTKKKVKLIEFSSNPCRFVLNLLYPLKPEVVLEADTIIIKTANNKEKGQIFGREKTNLKRIQSIVNKFFPLTIKIE